MKRTLRPAALAVGALAMSGCFLSSDLSGTAFLCAEEPVCPDGFSCVEGRCVAAEDSPDGGGAGGDDDGSDTGGGDEGTGPDGGGEPADFAFRQQLTIDNAGRGELIDFPLLVRLDGERFDFGAVRGDGADLEFRDADGVQLAHEIERWNPERQSIIWVRVPRIEAGSSAGTIWMYYGDPDAQVDTDEASVWSAYESVYHLDASDGEVDDAAERDYDGNLIGGNSEPGFIGLARRFDGAGQFIDLGAGRDFARAAPGLTVEAWVHPQILQQAVLFGAAGSASDNSRVELRYELDQTLRGGARTQEAGDLQAALTLEPLPLDDWSWVAMVCDFASGEVSIYINDHLSTVAGNLVFDDTTPDSPSTRAAIASDEALSSDFFGGLLDEVRLAPTALAPEWMAAQNASMRDQLVSYGEPEAL